MVRYWIALLTLIAVSIFTNVTGTALATEETSQEFVDLADPVQVALVAKEEGVLAGRPFKVAVSLRMVKDWHSYWKNPGDTGMPPEIQWTLPQGFTVRAVKWPCPERFSSEMGVSFGYQGSIYVIAEIIPPESLTINTVPIDAQVSWMACYDSCVPGTSSAHLSLPVVSSEPAVTKQWIDEVSSSERALPRDDLKAELIKRDGQWILAFGGMDSVKEAYFFAEQSGVLDHNADQQLSCQEGRCELKLLAAGDRIHSLEQLRGVLRLGSSRDSNATSLSWEVAVPVREEAAPPSAPSLSFAVALLLAFAGGLILNLMPCVLPVISFKVMSFIQLAAEKRKEIFKHSFAFFWGIMISFWALSSIMLILRAYGQSVGWGFQLQEPLFVGILAVLLFAFAMSLFGLFEFGTSISALAGKGDVKSHRKKGSLTGSFFSGVLATAVATPCTGPFLGATLGFAVTLPSFAALLIFTSMALGLATPYMLFAVFPSLLRFMPKPGAWMETFKQMMGFVIMATVLWLVWIFSALTVGFAVCLLLSALLAIGLAAWIFGKWGSAAKGRLSRSLSTVISLVLMVVALNQVLIATRYSSGMGDALAHTPLAGGVRSAPDSHVAWQPFSAEALAQYREKGIPVFVDFTAKWCLICQANKIVLHSEEVARQFAKRGVVTMVADWTRNDPEITRELKSFGRTGVPLYVLYGPVKKEAPLILPQMLTSSVLESSLDELFELSGGRRSEVAEGN